MKENEWKRSLTVICGAALQASRLADAVGRTRSDHIQDLIEMSRALQRPSLRCHLEVLPQLAMCGFQKLHN